MRAFVSFKFDPLRTNNVTRNLFILQFYILMNSECFFTMDHASFCMYTINFKQAIATFICMYVYTNVYVSLKAKSSYVTLTDLALVSQIQNISLNYLCQPTLKSFPSNGKYLQTHSLPANSKNLQFTHSQLFAILPTRL